MKFKKSSFTEGQKTLRVEGFRTEKLLSVCIREKITVSAVRTVSDTEIVLTVEGLDYERFCGFAKNNYRITVIGESGAAHLASVLMANKTAICGIIVFIVMILWQSMFVSEIRIHGFEKVPETRIRESLARAGFEEGCRRNIGIETVKLQVYEDIDEIVWIGIAGKGNLAEVTVVEGRIEKAKLPPEMPCNIVADRAGYIHAVNPESGVRAVETGQFVEAGQVLISGELPLAGAAAERVLAETAGKGVAGAAAISGLPLRYVHAGGTVTARIPYRFKEYQERYELEKKETGRHMYGFEITIGDKTVNTMAAAENLRHMLRNADPLSIASKIQAVSRPFYEVSVCHSREIVNKIRPLPFKITFLKSSEVTLSKRERTRQEMEALEKLQTASIIRENFPESLQISNKDLDFSPKENIMEISIMLEILQEIGTEQEIKFGEYERSNGETNN